VKATEEVATDPKKLPATVKDPETTTLPDKFREPVKVEGPTTLKDPELTKEPVNSIVSAAISITSPSIDTTSPETSKTLPVALYRLKDPVKAIEPEF
jgi:hypothetical protein